MLERLTHIYLSSCHRIIVTSETEFCIWDSECHLRCLVRVIFRSEKSQWVFSS